VSRVSSYLPLLPAAGLPAASYLGEVMPVPELCLGQSDTPGGGGVGSGGTSSPGQANTGGSSDTGYPVFSLVTDMKKTYDIQLYDTLIGENATDLEALGATSMKFVAKEMLHHTAKYIEKAVSFKTSPGTDGIVTLTLKPADTPYAGMWYAAIVAFDASGDVIAEWPMWLEVRKSLLQSLSYNTPINIGEIRLVLRDTVPEANNLLLQFEYSDTEIAFCIMRPVEEWNEMLPPVKTFTGATFPYRENWRKAAAGYLMRTASRKYLRDDLEYSAGGLSINDNRKWDAYGKLGQVLIDEWQTWAKQEKVRLNSQACYGNIGSAAFGSRRVY